MKKTFTLVKFIVLFAASVGVVLAQESFFDVVSLKPTSSSLEKSMTTWEPHRLWGSGVSLKQLIEWAYDVTDVQISGLPDSLSSRYFDLEAKSDSAHTREELLRMLQPVLAERFKLKLHRDTKQLPVYVLTAVPNHAELHNTKGGPASIQIPIQGQTIGGKGLSLQVVGQSVSMRYLTGYLTNSLGQLVIDKTGLTGSFDFKIQTSLDENEVTDKRTGLTTVILDAIRQLGFKLDSQKQPTEILVIDHAEEPSPN